MKELMISRLRGEKNGGFFATVRVSNNTVELSCGADGRLYKKLIRSGLLRLMFVVLVVNETKTASTAVIR
jgi:hypothetical protein